MAASLSTGTGADLLIFSGAMDICDAHENMERMAGYCVWMDDFVPMSFPHRHLIEIPTMAYPWRESVLRHSVGVLSCLPGR